MLPSPTAHKTMVPAHIENVEAFHLLLGVLVSWDSHQLALGRADRRWGCRGHREHPDRAFWEVC